MERSSINLNKCSIPLPKKYLGQKNTEAGNPCSYTLLHKLLYTEVSSRIDFWAGSKRRKSIKKKEGSIKQHIPLFFKCFNFIYFSNSRSSITSIQMSAILRSPSIPKLAQESAFGRD